MTDVALPQPARAQLLEIAGELLGRLAADEVPPTLRQFRKFSPTKRITLGASAIMAALDADEAFRGQVAEAVETASPQLAEAVRTGGSTAATAPIDIVVTAYLLRPDGWQATVTSALRRFADEQGRSDRQAQQLVQARTELAELKARAKGEAARVKEAVTAATGTLEAALAELRKQLRHETRLRREAERERDAGGERADLAQRELEKAAAAHEADLRRLRGRITELERAGESARREARTDRDLDDSRLWLLVQQLTDAAAGIRRELALPAPTVLPGDTVGGVTGAGDGRSVGDAAALDRLLVLPHVHVVVDGYNVTKTGYGELPLADQRKRLTQSLGALSGRLTGVEITVAFDGGQRPPVQSPAPRGVRVLFSDGEIADDLIRRLVSAEPSGRTTLVVTSDQAVVADVRRAGAWTVPSAVLLDLLARL